MSEIVGKGRFRLDRRRALDKLEQYRFEDPRRYVLELLAAAVCAGATSVELVNDSDDLVIRWDGRPLTGDELDTLFDPLFGSAGDAWSAARQHLAIGVLGALGLNPRWIRIDTGDTDASLRLDVRDPANTAHAPLSEGVTGVRVHVRERMSAAVVLEALLLAIRPPAEIELLRGTLHRYPIPLTVNGAPFPSHPEPPHWLLRWQGEARGRRASLWLVPVPSTVDLVRNGIVVHKLSRAIGAFWLTGALVADDLRLAASRSRVVEDQALHDADAALGVALRALLAHGLAALEPSDLDATLLIGPGRTTRGAALADLAPTVFPTLDGELGPWASVPCLVDLHGNRWSVASLKAEREPPCVSSVDAKVPGWTRPTFALSWANTLLLAGIRAPDVSPTHAAHAEGAARRARLAIERLPADLPGVARRFDRDGVRGAVAVAKEGGLRIRLQIDGLAVETRELPGAVGPVTAVADCLELSTDPAFRKVQTDAVLERVVAIVREEAEAHVIATLEGLLRDGDRVAALRLCTLVLQARTHGEPGRIDLLRPSLQPFTSLPVFTTGAGGHLSPVDAVKRGPWLILGGVRPMLPDADVADLLVFPHDLATAWRRLLGDAAADARPAVEARLARNHRLSRPRREPVATGPAHARHAIDRDGLKGELIVAPGTAPARVEVLRDGIPVTSIALDVPVPGLYGVVDAPAVGVTVAHDALLPEAEADLVRRLRREVDAMVRAAWEGWPEGEPARHFMLRWLASAPTDLARRIAGRHLIARRVDGTAVTGDEILAPPPKNAAKLDVLFTDPGVDTFGHALRGDDALRALLDAHVPRRWRDAEPAVRASREARRIFLGRAPYTPPEACARAPISGDGWAGEALLPTAPSVVGELDVVVRVDGRRLEQPGRNEQLGALVVVQGPALRPAPGYDRLAERGELGRLRKTASEALVGLVRAALASPGSAPVETWRALLTRTLALEPASELVGLLLTVPMFTDVDRQPLTPADVRAASAVSGVGISISPGAAPDGLCVRLESGVADLLAALRGAPVPDVTKATLELREGLGRRTSAPRRSARLDAPTRDRAPVDAPGATGEVGLVDRGDGLAIEYLVDGRLLAHAGVPCPVPARAVITGPAIVPDPAFRAPVGGPALDAVHARLREQVLALALAYGHTVKDQPGWASWCLKLALAGGEARDWPLVPRLDGTRASLAELEAEDRDHGGVAVAPGPHGRFPTVPVALTTNAVLQPLLATRIRLVDLTPRVAPPADPADPTRIGIRRVGRGRVGFTEAGTVAVRAGDLELARWDAVELGSPIPLGGWVDHADVVAGPLGKGLHETAPGAVDALRAEVVEAGQALMALIATGRRDHLVPRLLAAAQVLWGTRRALTAALEARHPLLDVPLVDDGDGVRHALRDVLAEQPIRLLEPDALPRRGPRADAFVVGPTVRVWLASVAKVVDVTQEIADREHGAWRRASASAPPRVPADHEPIGEHGAVWLTASRGAGAVSVVVDGRVVGRRAVPVDGAEGVLHGDFAVDVRFERATVPDAVWAEVIDALGRLLAREWHKQRWGRFDRVPRATQGKGRIPEPWASLALTTRGDGRPFTVEDAHKAARKAWTLSWYAPGEDPVDDALRIDPSELEAWRRLLVPARLDHVAPAPAPTPAPTPPRPATAPVRALLPSDVSAAAIAEVVDASTLPDALLTAYVLAARVLYQLGRTADELALIARVADDLAK